MKYSSYLLAFLLAYRAAATAGPADPSPNANKPGGGVWSRINLFEYQKLPDFNTGNMLWCPTAMFGPGVQQRWRLRWIDLFPSTTGTEHFFLPLHSGGWWIL